MTNTQTHTDIELIELFKNGSLEAYESIVKRHENKIYSIAMRYTKSEEDTEEIMQDVCMTLYNKLASFEGKSAFSSWLYRIVVNASLMKLRKRRQDKAIPLEDLSIGIKNEVFEKASEELQKADARTMQHEIRDLIKNAINKLDLEYRTVYVMRDIDGLSNQEVSNVLNISTPAVKSRLHRARLMLRKKLNNYWQDYNGEKRIVNLGKLANV